MRVLSIAWYLLVQFLMGISSLLGLLILIIPSLLSSWEPSPIPSIKDGRKIDRWKWRPLNWLYGNPEDGVSGQTALVRGSDPYMPTSDPRWRAYRWSAIRNSSDNLKYVFSWNKGPLWTVGRLKFGWQPENGFRVPIISLMEA